MQAGTSTNTTTSALKTLTLPDLDGLSEQQIRGTACVWDGITLTPATAVSLGIQAASRAGAPVSWYPRACRRCVAEHAYRAILDHTRDCTRCVDEPALCETGRALNRLVRENRR